MAERERTRVRERGTAEQSAYDKLMKLRQEFCDRQYNGTIVVKGSTRELQIIRQGRIYYYLDPLQYKDTALQDWMLFIQDIRTHSGKHVHQGGVIIYVLKGRGYSIVNGERKDWEEGDLLLLPLVPGGVEHQHFNTDPGSECQWIAFDYQGIRDQIGSDFKQVEVSPEYKG
jgi:hypothetical protein